LTQRATQYCAARFAKSGELSALFDAIAGRIYNIDAMRFEKKPKIESELVSGSASRSGNDRGCA
jgi:hypothetical protein